MGVNFVIIVENSNNISLAQFKAELLKEPVWGPLAWSPYEDDRSSEQDTWSPWEEFSWEGKKYFTWLSSPRLTTFDIYEYDEKEDEPDNYTITFLKIMLLIERVAGGPIHIGNDVVQLKHPEDADEENGFPFWIPSELDSYLENWREIAQLEAEPAIIF